MSKEPKRNVYVGHRYVPKIMGEWDKQETYEGLSIVTHEGTSYTSKKRVPVGIDILNEEYWVVTGNYNAQVESYRQDVRNMEQRVNDTMNDTVENVNNTLNAFNKDLIDRGTNLKNYADQVINNDWGEVINTIIEDLSDKGGGLLVIPQGDYKYSSDIHIKENVTIQGVQGVNFIQSNNAKVFMYSRSTIIDVEFIISNDFNDGAIVFDNKYLRRNDTDISLPEGVNVYLERVSVITEFNSMTSNKSSFKFYATFSGDANAHGAGFARVNMLDCSVRDINVGIDIETDKTGWVNGNNLDVRMHGIVNAVRIKRSPESLGVDYNIFKLYIQCNDKTRDLFIDGGNSNNYDGCTIWDMASYTEARVGTGPLKNIQNGISLPKHRYATYLLRKRYHLIGRFKKFDSLVHNVTISMKSYENYNIEFFIRGGSRPIVERRILGSYFDSEDDDFEFYIRELNNGEVELYIYNTLDIEIEKVPYIESFTRVFFPSPYTAYSNVDNLVKLDVYNYYTHDRSIQRVKLVSENDHTGYTKRKEFDYGITYSGITSSIPEEERGTPENKLGRIKTEITQGAASYNSQEFHVFGSSGYTIYRRYGNDTEFGWGEWIAPITP